MMCFLYKYEDQSTVLQYSEKGQVGVCGDCLPVIPALGEVDTDDPWTTLASKISRFSELARDLAL